MNEIWRKRFFELAHVVAGWSKDECRKVGCVIVDETYKDVIAIGVNGFPRGINDTISERQQKPEKYMWFAHAESNAIDNAARTGRSLLNTSIFCTFFPCCDCARRIINSGIKKVYVEDLERDKKNENWIESINVSLQMFKEANIEIINQ